MTTYLDQPSHAPYLIPERLVYEGVGLPDVWEDGAGKVAWGVIPRPSGWEKLNSREAVARIAVSGEG